MVVATEKVTITIEEVRVADRRRPARAVPGPVAGDHPRGRRPDGRAHLERAAQGHRGAAAAHRLAAVRAEPAGRRGDDPLPVPRRRPAGAAGRRRRARSWSGTASSRPSRRRRRAPRRATSAWRGGSPVTRRRASAAPRPSSSPRPSAASATPSSPRPTSSRSRRRGEGGDRGPRRGREAPSCCARSGRRTARRSRRRLRAQIRQLEEEQKRRATRAQRDVLDRSLVDLLSLYRDVLVVQLGADVDLVNTAEEGGVRRLAGCVDRPSRRSAGWTRSARPASASPGTSRRCWPWRRWRWRSARRAEARGAGHRLRLAPCSDPTRTRTRARVAGPASPRRRTAPRRLRRAKDQTTPPAPEEDGPPTEDPGVAGQGLEARSTART